MKGRHAGSKADRKLLFTEKKTSRQEGRELGQQQKNRAGRENRSVWKREKQVLTKKMACFEKYADFGVPNIEY
jgi:hypothetical protein